MAESPECPKATIGFDSSSDTVPPPPAPLFPPSKNKMSLGRHPKQLFSDEWDLGLYWTVEMVFVLVLVLILVLLLMLVLVSGLDW